MAGIKVRTEPTSFEVIDKNLAAEKYIVGKKKNVLNAELKNTGSHSDLEKKIVRVACTYTGGNISVTCCLLEMYRCSCELFFVVCVLLIFIKHLVQSRES